jgi:hypothetical protein
VDIAELTVLLRERVALPDRFRLVAWILAQNLGIAMGYHRTCWEMLMQQPKEYRVEYVAIEDVPYRNIDPNAKGTHAGDGIFHEGRVVWLTNALRADESGEIFAYADGAGLVLVNSRSLKAC